jgi:hypothetical protein
LKAARARWTSSVSNARPWFEREALGDDVTVGPQQTDHPADFLEDALVGEQGQFQSPREHAAVPEHRPGTSGGRFVIVVTACDVEECLARRRCRVEDGDVGGTAVALRTVFALPQPAATLDERGGAQGDERAEGGVEETRPFHVPTFPRP